MKRQMMALLCAFVVKAAVAETIDVTAANFESHRTLANGNTYRFAEDIGYTARETESAMKVADGANVVMEITKGVTVKLTGGAEIGKLNTMEAIAKPSSCPVGAPLSYLATASRRLRRWITRRRMLNQQKASVCVGEGADATRFCNCLD